MVTTPPLPEDAREADPLVGWALGRIPQAPPDARPIDDELLVALATGAIGRSERERLLARLAVDPEARELVAALVEEAEAAGLAAPEAEAEAEAPAIPFLAPRRRWATPSGLALAASIALTTTVGLSWYASTRPGVDDPAASRFSRLTDLGYGPGLTSRLAPKGVGDAAEDPREAGASPDDREAWLGRGRTLLRAMKPGADAPFRLALGRDAGDAEALNGLGQALYAGLAGDPPRPRAEQVAEAVEVFRRAADLAPASASLRLNLAMSLDAAGRSAEAAEAYRAALAPGGDLTDDLRASVSDRVKDLEGSRNP
ncbi:MAG: hypothetical protein BGO49_10975 [Planctomycetales bacterium 71-10]|nr:MAG: hypothetical protein BGO49_10975 [Planctomycetales bacterium 71-10]